MKGQALTPLIRTNTFYFSNIAVTSLLSENVNIHSLNGATIVRWQLYPGNVDNDLALCVAIVLMLVFSFGG